MTTTPTFEPAELRAGLTWEWTRADLAADYPSSTWTLKYWFKKTDGTANFSITATASGTGYAISETAINTGAYTAGEYTWAAVVTSGSVVKEVDTGAMTVLPRYDSAANVDARSTNRKILDAIQAVILGRAAKDQQEYAINGRMLKLTPLADLQALEQTYLRRVANEQARLAGRATGPLGRVSYGVPGR